MSSKIEDMIDEIENYIDGCKFQTLSQTRIIVNKDDIDSLLRELRLATPEEIKRYQKMLANRDAILDDARKKAEKLLEETTRQSNELVNESEIMQQAYAKANDIVSMATNQGQEILDQAVTEANAIRNSAMEYVDNLLANLEAIVTQTTSVATDNFNELIGNLNSFNGIIKENRYELAAKDENPVEELLSESQDVSGSLDIL